MLSQSYAPVKKSDDSISRSGSGGSWSRRCARSPCYANRQAIELLGKVVPSVTPDQFAEVYQVYLAGTDQPYPIENMAVIRALRVNARELMT